MELYPRQRAERSEKNGGLGEDPPGSPMTDQERTLKLFGLRMAGIPTKAKEIRAKRGGGWLLFKHQINHLQSSDGTLPTTARRAKRENGGLGEDPPGSPMSHQERRLQLFGVRMAGRGSPPGTYNGTFLRRVRRHTKAYESRIISGTFLLWIL
jgi:hypothetical protein